MKVIGSGSSLTSGVFFQTAIKKLLHYLPLKNHILRDLQITCPTAQQKPWSLEAVRRIARAFSRIDPSIDVDQVVSNWRTYTLEDIKDIQNAATNNSKIDIAKFWKAVGELQMPSGEKKYTEITKIMMLCMTIAHGNADTERSFSQSALILTKHRNRICIDTLNGLMAVKSAMSVTNVKSHSVDISPQMLECCRQAHSKYALRLQDAERREKTMKLKKTEDTTGETIRPRI